MKNYDTNSHIVMLAVLFTFVMAYIIIAKAFEANREVEATHIERKK